MHLDALVNPWQLQPARRSRGGRLLVPGNAAPLGRMLPYRRATGETPGQGRVRLHSNGWSAELGVRGLGDMLLGLGLAQALIDATGEAAELTYRGSRTALMERCDLPLTVQSSTGIHRIVHRNGGQRWTAVPEEPPTWLDHLNDEITEVHAALGMRYYLTVEQRLGVRLPANQPLPHFTSTETTRPGHIVFIAATSWPERKDYGTTRFAQTARALAEHAPMPLTFTLITGEDHPEAANTEFTLQAGLDASDCVDVFASAELVVGNDTGLTHLAALTRGSRGTRPEVIGLYGRHAHTKWTTGTAHHHALATAFSQMLAAADRCPVRDNLTDTAWGAAANLDRITPETIAEFAAELLHWNQP